MAGRNRKDAPPADAKNRGKRVTARTAAADAQAIVDSHRPEDSSELFGITELCREFGISQRALRFYEDKELIAPRRINNTRVYTRRDRARLALILRAKAIGSPLSEIKHYLDLYGTHGEGRAQQLSYAIERTDQLIHALEQKRTRIDATIAELRLINISSRRQMEKRRGTSAPKQIRTADSIPAKKKL